MSRKLALILAGTALAGAALVVLPCRAQVLQARDLWKLKQQLREEAARIQSEGQETLARFARVELPEQLARASAMRAEQLAAVQAQVAQVAAQKEHIAEQALAMADQARVMAEQEAQDQELRMMFGEDDGGPSLLEDGESGWLGVGIEEVASEKAKELKLPAVRGVLVTEVEADSPAAKVGLKANDVITEYNGQRIEGALQFRRMIRETPAGRAAQLTVWRHGRAQTLSIELGGFRQKFEKRVHVFGPKEFKFEMPHFDFNAMTPRSPRLGISAEDLSGQLGTYFGAPEGEGVLVKEVAPGSPAEKAGMKSGDVIVKIDGERVRTVGDLRERMRTKHEAKTASVTVIRKGAETTLSVEVEQSKPPAPHKRMVSHRTAI